MSADSPGAGQETRQRHSGRLDGRGKWTRLRAVGAAVVLSGALVLTGCTGPSGTSAVPDPTLRIGVPAIPTTLDPGQNLLHTQGSIAGLITGTLTNLSSDGKSVSMGLAESITPGDGRYVVKLKPDLKFSDGSALTSADVVASFKHYIGDKTNGADYTFAPIEKVEATDDLTVEFGLKRPYPSFPFILSYPTSAIVPSEPIESKSPEELYKGDPLPTAGKYQVQSLDQNEIVLHVNPNYAGEQPSTKTLFFKKITDPAARLAQVQGGQIDFADEVPVKQLNQLFSPVEGRATRAVNGVTFLGMNNRENSVLSDVRIRRAIAVAIDRKQINEIAYGGQNHTALGLFASSSEFSGPFLPEDVDTARAKELLAGTKCATGCTLRFIAVSDDEAHSDIALVVQQNLKAIGIEVSIEKSEKPVVSQSALQGNYDLRAAGIFDYSDIPDTFLSYTLGPTVKALRTGYSNPEMDRLIQTALTTSGSDRAAAIDDVKALFEKDLPLVPMLDTVYGSASRVPAERFAANPTFFYHVG